MPYRRFKKVLRKKPLKTVAIYENGMYRQRKRNVKIPMGFPEKTKVWLRYCEVGTMNSAAAPATAVYRANGLYDPSVSVGGHQCLFRDTYATIYDHYVVHESKIKATFWTEDAATRYMLCAGIKLDDDTSISPSASIEALVEQPNKLTKFKYFRADAIADKSQCTVHHKFNAKRFFGVKDIADNVAELGAQVNADPTDQACFILFYAHPSSAVDVPVIYYQVVIDYLVEFSELQDITQS